MDKIFYKMQEIKDEAERIFVTNKLQDKGFIKCNIFGNILKQHKILLIGINPGGDEKDVIDDPNEVSFYKEHPNYNEFIDENYTLIWGLRNLYKNAFGEEYVDNMLNNTFYWNLCLCRTNKPASEMGKSIYIAYDLYWELFLKIINNVKPDIILTFVSNKDFFQKKFNIEFDRTRLVENISHYYYWFDNLNINGFTVKKTISINHLSKTYFNAEEWVVYGNRFKKDYESVLNQNSNLSDYEKQDINYDKSKYFIIDSFLNPIDDLETILFLNKRKSDLKWKSIILHLHHALYMYCVTILQGTNPDEVTNTRYDNNKNIMFKKGDEKWKKSRIVRYKETPLFQFSWDTVDYEPELKENSFNEEETNRNLISFWTAIARIQDGELYMGIFIDSTPIIFSEEEKDAILKLNEYRNNFEHFIPKLWAINIGELNNIGSIIMNIIERITQLFEFRYLPNKVLLERNDGLLKELKMIFNK